jgi:predicted PP-loop superfamily ATPase
MATKESARNDSLHKELLEAFEEVEKLKQQIKVLERQREVLLACLTNEVWNGTKS